MKINLNNLFKYKKTSLLTFLGFVFLLYYIWFRFIRQRLPQEIPFNLTLLRLVIIIIIIICFSLVIKQFVKPSTNVHLQQVIYDILIVITHPFIVLDNYLKNNKLFKAIIKILFKIFFADTFNYKKTSYFHFQEFFNKWFILPKILLVILFLFDVFYLHKLFLIYSFVILAALPLIWAYFLYLMQYYQEEYIIFLETWYEVEELSKRELGYTNLFGERTVNMYMPCDGDGGETTIRTFLFFYNDFHDNEEPLRFKCFLPWRIVSPHFNIDEQRIWMIGVESEDGNGKLNSRQRDYLEKDFYDLIPLVIKMYEFTGSYSFYKEEYFTKEIKYKIINITIYSLYLIGWIYILIVSLPSLYLLPFEEVLLERFQDIYEPFSNLPMEPPS